MAQAGSGRARDLPLTAAALWVSAEGSDTFDSARSIVGTHPIASVRRSADSAGISAMVPRSTRPPSPTIAASSAIQTREDCRSIAVTRRAHRCIILDKSGPSSTCYKAACSPLQELGGILVMSNRW